jgi:hypothetical protein
MDAKPLIFVPRGGHAPSFVRLYPHSCLVSIDDEALFVCGKPLYPAFFIPLFRKFISTTTQTGLTRDDCDNLLIFILARCETSEQSFGIWAALLPTRDGVPLLRFVIRLQRFVRRQARRKAVVFVAGFRECVPDDLLRAIVRMTF